MLHMKAGVQINSLVAVTHISSECFASFIRIVNESSDNSIK